ncbi:MAG: NnrS family protein [Gammaproteobacteria bacterium]|nr:NnrS family protein [Gammaproteobacteria bacterium]
MISIEATWSRGFRPFFLGASVFAVVSMLNWMSVYLYARPVDVASVGPFLWHAHEMVFGYAMAVIAGFLLTAAWNWTGQKTLAGAGLALLFALWLLARGLMLGGVDHLAAATAADLAFMIGLLVAVARPVLKTRQKRQALVLLVLLLLAVARLLFYLGSEGLVPRGAHLSVHGGLYLVLGMLLFMGRRVIPFFTQRGVGYEVELRNERWNDIATLLLYPLFMLSELAAPFGLAGSLLAGALFMLNTHRVMQWHTLGIWEKPLLWSLFLAFVMVNLGFLLRALMQVTALPALLPVHAYAVGGIGVATLSMMARVTLGHTGRNVHLTPPVIILLLIGMLGAAVFRVLGPLADASIYPVWVGASAMLWVLCFGLFTLVFAPMLLGKRADR